LPTDLFLLALFALCRYLALGLLFRHGRELE
jgi:hypothetical protein